MGNKHPDSVALARVRLMVAEESGARLEVHYRVRAAQVRGRWHICKVLRWHRTRATVVLPIRRKEGVDLIERVVSIDALRVSHRQDRPGEERRCG